MKRFLFMSLFFCFTLAHSETIYYVTMRKSGTHLLEKYLRLLLSANDKAYDHTTENIEKRYVRAIKHPGLNIYWKHLCSDHLKKSRIPENVKKIILIRDPRDVLISATHFIPRMPSGRKHLFVKKWAQLEFEDKITSMITQTCPTEKLEKSLHKTFREKGILLPCMNVFVGQFPIALEYIEMPNTLLIRFEDIIGPQGGGSKEAQFEAMSKIADFIGVPLDEEKYEKIAQDIFGGTHTFRSGQIGAWKEVFTDEQLELFYENYGDILEKLGYQ